MPIVPAKCTNCGANLQVDNSYASMICPFCGCNFVIEQAVYNYNYNTNIINNIANANINIVGANINNLLTLAKNAEDVNNCDDALKYYNQALEIEPMNCKALLGKAVNSILTATLDTMNITELTGYTAKALELKHKEVMSHNLRGKEYTDFLLEAVKKLYGAAMAVMATAQANYNDTWKLSDSALVYWNRLQKVINIFQYIIDITKDSKNKDIMFYHKESIKFVMDCCVEICKEREYVSEVVVSGAFAGQEVMAKVKTTVEDHNHFLSLYDTMLAEIKELEPDYVPKGINRNAEINKGCYVATCVYGSYDCPEVWVLRRYRDYSLDKTWYGRAFIRLYYAFSPTIVRLLGRKNWFRAFWRKHLDKMVTDLMNRGYESSKYMDKY